MGELGPTMAGRGAEVILGLHVHPLVCEAGPEARGTDGGQPRDSGACAYPTVGQSWVLPFCCRALGVLVLVPTQWCGSAS